MGDGWAAARARLDLTFVPAADVRVHIDRLRRAGWTYRQIAERTGMCYNHVSKIHRGKVARVSESTASAIAAIDPAPDGPLLRQRFDAEPLLCAIAAMFATQKEAAEFLEGRDSPLATTFSQWRQGGLHWVQADRWANRFKMHPAEVWDDWGAWEPDDDDEPAAV